jgi:hypothetical protein
MSYSLWRYLLVFALIFIFSGCTRLQYLDERAGEIFFNASSSVEMNENKTEKITADELSREDKDQIDAWLAENDLNRYGDKLNTFYTGGTPLFDEVTGESKERFEYILEKIPDIMEKINSN